MRIFLRFSSSQNFIFLRVIFQLQFNQVIKWRCYSTTRCCRTALSPGPRALHRHRFAGRRWGRFVCHLNKNKKHPQIVVLRPPWWIYFNLSHIGQTAMSFRSIRRIKHLRAMPLSGYIAQFAHFFWVTWRFSVVIVAMVTKEVCFLKGRRG